MATITFTIPDAVLDKIRIEVISGTWQVDFNASGLTAKQFISKKMLDLFFNALATKKQGEAVRTKQLEGMQVVASYKQELDQAKSVISSS